MKPTIINHPFRAALDKDLINFFETLQKVDEERDRLRRN